MNIQLYNFRNVASRPEKNNKAQGEREGYINAIRYRGRIYPGHKDGA